MHEKVAIVDYEMGNLDSIARAVEECGGRPVITSNRSDFKTASNIILPGVGSFAHGIANIHKLGLYETLNEEIMNQGTPCLGICLGMQLFATKGFEGGETKGLAWIDGEVRKLEPKQSGSRIPHIGWNKVTFDRPSLLFKDIPSGKDFYFVHSYHFVCKDENHILASTPYCGHFASAIYKNNIFGVQFHPEKSQRFGLQLIRNFLSL